jgi:hypothetical protein
MTISSAGAATFSGYIAGSYSGNLWMQATGSNIFMIDSDNNSTGEAFYWRKNASGSGGTDLMSLTEAGDLSINATRKLYFDGGGDSYIAETTANVMSFYAGAANPLNLRTTGVYVSNAPMYIDPTQKLYLDGGGDSYIYEYSANKVAVYTGGYSNFIFMGVSGGPVFNLSNVGFGVGGGDKIYFDANATSGGGDTYIQENSANQLTVVAGGAEGINITSAGIWKTTWGTTAASANAYVADGNYLLRSTSSIRYKHDIDTLDADHALSAVMAMRPVTYRGKTDDDQRRYVGFIAEEMQTIAPLLATYDEGGETGTPNYVTYDRVTAYLVAVVQKQQAEINALKAQMKEKQ